MMTTTKKTTATATNLWVLGKVFGGKRTVTNVLDASEGPHIKRCLAAGLVTIEGGQLVLTAEGAARLGLK